MGIAPARSDMHEDMEMGILVHGTASTPQVVA